MTALASGIVLAPAYLLVSIRRHRGYGMRVFVVSSLAILILSGLRIVPGRIDLIVVYLFVPPVAGACVGVAHYILGARRSGYAHFRE